MNTKLYVGNLSYDITESALKEMFAPHGAVTEINVVMDRETGKPRGFAFVTLASKEAADAAINALNGRDYQGRSLTVNEARPREERPAYSASGGGSNRRS